MDNFNPMKESGADYLARTSVQPPKFEPQTITVDEFRRRQREKRRALGIPQVEPYKLASERPINRDAPEPGSLDYYVEQQKEQIQEQSKPSSYGYFEMSGKRHENVGNGWNVLKPGQAARDPNIEREYQEKMKKKPGNVTGKPLLPSKLFM